ncbi:MAG: hypothetical protein AB8H86_25860 [Polyangiales bacterium]
MRLLLLLLITACSIDSTGLLPANEDDGGPGLDAGAFDGGAAIDGSPASDGAMAVDGGPTLDGGPATDSGQPDVGAADGGPLPDVPPDVFDAGNDAGCITESCEGNTYVSCNEDGTTDRRDCDFACFSGGDAFAGIGCYDLDPSNLDDPMSDVPDSRRPTLIDGTENWSTNDCASLPGYWKVVDQPGSRPLCVLSFGDIEFRGDVRVFGGRALLIVSTGTVTISGSFRADADGVVPGAGGGRGGERGVTAGGPNPGTAGLLLGEYTDGGGGGGGCRFEGGTGGIAGGLSGSATSGAAPGGGAFGGGYTGVPLRGGSGGGVGGGGESAGSGGGGGGAVQITARFGINLSPTAVIDVGGGGGSGGQDGNLGDNNIGAGGGGGSGGVVLLESAGNMQLFGGFYAPGGGGGGGAGCRARGNAGDGRQNSPGDVGGGVNGPACGNGNFFGAVGGPGGVFSAGILGGENRQWGANGGGGGGGGGLLLVRSPTNTGRGRESRPNIVRVD